MWRTASGLPRLLLERQPRTSERLSMLCFLVAALQQTSTLFVLPSQWSEDGCTQAMPLLSSRGTCVQALWLSLDRKFSLLTGHAAYPAYPMLSGHGLADITSEICLPRTFSPTCRHTPVHVLNWLSSMFTNPANWQVKPASNPKFPGTRPASTCFFVVQGDPCAFPFMSCSCTSRSGPCRACK